MKKRRILSAALATIMALGLSVPSYALEEGGTSPTPIIEEGGEVNPGGGSIDDIIIPITGDDEIAIEEEEVSEAKGGPWGPWEPEKPSHNDFQVNSLNFYINLAGDVLDTKEGSGHYYATRFTSALTSAYSVDGSGLEAAVMAHPDYVYISSYYDGIVGANESDYARIDGEIRNVLSSYISVPSDSDILANVKTQIQNGTKINDINGAMISDSLVSTDYFNVYWYVLKEGNSEWHVDGILEKKDVPTVNTCLVEYWWKVLGGPGLPSSYEVPATVEYAEGDMVDIDTTYTEGMEVSVDGGKYVFSGWDMKESFEIHSDNSIYGEWTWIPDEPVVEPTPVRFMIPVQKLLDGAAPTREFTFTLNTEDDTLQTVTTDSENFSFDPIEYTEVGTYQYTVKESIDGSDDGIIYDNSVYDVTIDIVLDEENNKLEALAEYSLNGETVNKIVFNNTTKDEPILDPEPITVSLNATKLLDGQIPDVAFEFELKDSTGNVLQTEVNRGSSIIFDEITFDAAGTYEYTITEKTNISNSGVIYDTNVYGVKVTITLDEAHNIYTADFEYSANGVALEDQSTGIVFNNTTKDEPRTPATLVLTGKKLLDGQTPSDQFTFELLDAYYNVISTTKNIDSMITFDALTYEDADSYIYHIREVSDASMTNINFDSTEYTIGVEVSFDSENNRYVTNVIDMNGDPITGDDIVFNNTTKEVPPPTPPATEDPDPIEITLQGVKYLDKQVAGGFTFVVSDGSSILANVHSNDNGVFKFVDSINEPGRYNYIIREQIPDNTGDIIYDDSFYTAEITIALNEETNEYYIANQSLQHVVGMGEITDAQMIIFNNTTKENPPIDPPTPPVKDPTAASVVLSGEKYLDKNAPSTQFDFVLKDSTGKEIETVKNTGKDFTFGALAFNKEGTYRYTINEVTGNNSKIKYDNTVYTVVIMVTLDHAKNAYVADVVITSNTNTGNLNAIVFNNETISDPDPRPDPKPRPNPDPKPEPKPDPKPTPTPDPIPTPEPTPDPVIIPEPVEEPKDEPKIDDVPKTGEPVSLSLAFATLISTLGTMGFINRKKKDEDQ